MVAGKVVYDEFAKQLGAAHDELAATQQDVEDANKAATQAEKDAAAAKQDAADASTETDKAEGGGEPGEGRVTGRPVEGRGRAGLRQGLHRGVRRVVRGRQRERPGRDRAQGPPERHRRLQGRARGRVARAARAGLAQSAPWPAAGVRSPVDTAGAALRAGAILAAGRSSRIGRRPPAAKRFLARMLTAGAFERSPWPTRTTPSPTRMMSPPSSEAEAGVAEARVESGSSGTKTRTRLACSRRTPRARLDAETDARGRSLEVVELPLPGPILITEDEAHRSHRGHAAPPPRGPPGLARTRTSTSAPEASSSRCWTSASTPRSSTSSARSSPDARS